MSWLIETGLAVSLLLALVLLLRRPVARHFGAHAAYALWLLPALRLLLPPLPGWQPLFSLASPAAGPVADIASLPAPLPADAITTAVAPPSAVPAAPDLLPDAGTLLLVLWLLGAAGYLALQLWRYRRFMAAALAEAQLLDAQAGIAVLLTPVVDGPLAAGFWQRRVLLPADFASRYAPAERRFALLHEAAHHDRFDLWANAAALLVVALNWFNPLAHVAFRAFRADQEQACDATVLAGLGRDARAQYGLTVLKSAATLRPAAVCAMNHKSQLKERIAMMKDRNFTRTRLVMGAATVLAAMGLGLAATASGADQPAPPAPPAPPAAPAAPTPPAPPSPPSPPEAPAMVSKPDRVMVFKLHKDGKPGKDGTTIVMDGKAGTPMVLNGDGVITTRSEDGKRIVMVRRLAAGAEKDAAAAMKQADMAGVAAGMAAVRAELAARCERTGKKMAADAELDELAMCGIDTAKLVNQSLAAARAAIEKSRDLTAEQRAEALKGIDEAMAQNGPVVVKIK
ncbi:MAG: M56 family metallopeptidase [Sphingomonadales bacterium]|jgi:beta-lactamase regulating signal transducer with metallopeptidase domain